MNMKRYIVVVSATLLTLAPMRLLTMEKKEFSVLSKTDIESRANDLAQKYQNINKIQDVNTVREGIFEATTVITQAANEDVSTIKSIRKELRKQLNQLVPNKSQEQIFDVSSPESDDEDNTAVNMTSNIYYLKYQAAEKIITKNNSKILAFEQNIKKVEQAKSKKTLEIQQLQNSTSKAQQEETALDAQITTQQEELNLGKKAIEILQLKKETQKATMHKQETELSEAVRKAQQEIITLKQEVSELTDKEAIKKQKI